MVQTERPARPRRGLPTYQELESGALRDSDLSVLPSHLWLEVALRALCSGREARRGGRPPRAPPDCPAQTGPGKSTRGATQVTAHAPLEPHAPVTGATRRKPQHAHGAPQWSTTTPGVACRRCSAVRHADHDADARSTHALATALEDHERLSREQKPNVASGHCGTVRTSWVRNTTINITFLSLPTRFALSCSPPHSRLAPPA
jgi:hypothetical protein